MFRVFANGLGACDSVLGRFIPKSAANQGDNTATETMLSPWLAADEARVSHVLLHVLL